MERFNDEKNLTFNLIETFFNLFLVLPLNSRLVTQKFLHGQRYQYGFYNCLTGFDMIS